MPRLCRLYLNSSPAIDDPAAFAALAEASLAAGEVAALQVRVKPASDEAVAAVVQALMPVCRARAVSPILN